MKPNAEDILIRHARTDDIPALQSLSQNGYIDSRFYVDEHFPRERCQAFYETWIRKAVEAGIELVLVAEIDNIVQGYIICHQDIPEKQQIRLDLVAVRQEARRKGVGQMLFQGTFEWCKRKGIEYIWSATQIRNIAAQCLFQRMGFLPRSCQLYYHKWF